MEFRRDINGLRAIAVLAVIVFHFDPNLLPGGFSGVDVFFVISGFLMTGIIFKDIEFGTFSIIKFYAARARRIVPALAILCLVLFIFGYLFLAPKDYESLGKHASSSLLFFSNFIYWGEHGYFDAGSHEKWLLHTWSLSVEWQFYILYPVAVVVVARVFGLNTTRRLIPVVALFGFVGCVLLSHYDSNSAFYLLPARAWEMLLGGVAFLYPVNTSERNARVLEAFGWSLIIGSFAFLNGAHMWPGYLALIPTVGAFLVIQASAKKTFFISGWLIQSIGLYSYSLYLWHWPIIVGVAYLGLSKNIAAMFAVLALFSVMSYRFVEKRQLSFHAKFVIYCTVLVCTASGFLLDGYKFRVSPEFQLNEQQYHSYYYGGYGFAIDRVSYVGAEKSEYDAVFAGDSLALQYARMLDQAGKEKNLRFATLFHHGCLILPTYTRYANGKEDPSCGSEYAKLMAELRKNKAAPLILAGSWKYYNNNSGFRGAGKPTVFDDYSEFHSVLTSELQQLIEEGGADRQYYIVGSPHRTEVYAFRCLTQTELLGSRALHACQEEEEVQENATNDALDEFSKGRDNVHFINPNDVLCSDEKCLLILNRQPIHSDRTHLSVVGAEVVGRLILKQAGLLPDKDNTLVYH